RMGAASVLVARRRALAPRQLFLRAAELYAERFSGADGRILATFDIVTLTAWAPDAGQPKPLAPGSARVRLADALGTIENPTDLDDKGG
ncbi:MAG: SAM-dependent methyltransferase, partial [Hyphomicrobiaceae bacterium]|nr:SAM-dependent methyltransferase [Hyphomicrobiaceae bacterium]